MKHHQIALALRLGISRLSVKTCSYCFGRDSHFFSVSSARQLNLKFLPRRLPSDNHTKSLLCLLAVFNPNSKYERHTQPFMSTSKPYKETICPDGQDFAAQSIAQVDRKRQWISSRFQSSFTFAPTANKSSLMISRGYTSCSRSYRSSGISTRLLSKAK